jgi:NADH:ubiquinone oxidoreductase subunit 4 (subunit M)
MNFPILSIITFLPFVAAVIMLVMPANRKTEVRGVALATAAIDLLLFWLDVCAVPAWRHDRLSIH